MMKMITRYICDDCGDTIETPALASVPGGWVQADNRLLCCVCDVKQRMPRVLCVACREVSFRIGVLAFDGSRVCTDVCARLWKVIKIGAIERETVAMEAAIIEALTI